MKKVFKKYLPDKWFIFPIVGLSLCLILKLIQTAIDFCRFPFHSIVDLEGRVIFLFFLNKYGFHQLINDAYHHIILFKAYPPGWYYFTLPFHIISGNLLVAIFLSLLATLVLGFLFIYFFNKNIRPVKRVAFFLFFFANLQMIDYFQIGRYPEMLGWIIFIPLFYYAMLYKKRKVDFKFFLITLILFLSLILTNIYVAAVSSTILISLFLVKNYKERLIIFLTMLASFALTSFWWIPFLDFIRNINRDTGWIKELLHSGSFISYNTIFILGLFLISFFYINQIRDKKNSKDVLFLIPSLILGFLMLTRLIVFIPLFNRVPVTPYNIYFLFLAVYLFFQTDFKIKKVKNVIPIILIFLTLSSLFIFYLRITPFILPKDELKEEIISFFPIIEDNFFIFNFGDTKQELSRFAKINYNLSSPAPLISQLLSHNLKEEPELKEVFKNQDCEKLKMLIKKLRLKNLISYDQGCDILMKCGFHEKIHKERACLYSTDKLFKNFSN